jgi:hypothetical protein
MPDPMEGIEERGMWFVLPSNYVIMILKAKEA